VCADALSCLLVVMNRKRAHNEVASAAPVPPLSMSTGGSATAAGPASPSADGGGSDTPVDKKHKTGEGVDFERVSALFSVCRSSLSFPFDFLPCYWLSECWFYLSCYALRTI
jgi:hypothetical protein